MELSPGLEVHGLCLFLREYRVLVFADVHLGYEEELRASGYPVPRTQYGLVKEHVGKVLDEVSPEAVVIAGDLKHEFCRISSQEWTEVLGFLDFLESRVRKVILVRGNHDTIMGPIAERRDVEVSDGFSTVDGRIRVIHGHEVPKDESFKRAETFIIGHDHPALTLRDGVRTEKVKCFLKGIWKDKTLIQLPSLCFAAEGSDPLQETPLSPFMQQRLDEFEAYCIEGFDVFYFGRLKEHR